MSETTNGTLVLGRREGQRLRIRVNIPGGEPVDIWVSLGRCRQGSILVQAPKDVSVMREENIVEDTPAGGHP